MLNTFTELHYNSNDAPVAETLCITPVAEIDVIADNGVGMAQEILGIRALAWGTAAWYAEAMGSEQVAATLAGELFDPGNQYVLEPMRRKVVRAADGSNPTMLLAVQTDHGGGSSAIVGVGEFQDDPSGNALVRGFRRAVRPGAVVALADHVDVRPGFQDYGIGTALFYAGMLRFRRGQEPRVGIPSSNRDLLNRLGSYDFQPVASQKRTELGGNIRELELVAPSVGHVLVKMVEHDPWLESGIMKR